MAQEPDAIPDRAKRLKIRRIKTRNQGSFKKILWSAAIYPFSARSLLALTKKIAEGAFSSALQPFCFRSLLAHKREPKHM
jgi:hypothetical protein